MINGAVKSDLLQEEIVYQRPSLLNDIRTTYCPGCSHGVVHRLIAEVFEDMPMREEMILVASVGCSLLVYDYLDVDGIEAPHGRAPAVATGVKRVRPDKLVVAYQGDGDLAAIGTAEIIHAATRGENISVIFINNAIYGMTGGQMAPTTLPGMKTLSSPMGRTPQLHGNPLKMCELLATLQGPAYLVRRHVYDPAGIARTKKAIETAFKVQRAGLGFSMVEILAACPTNWALDPAIALAWGKANMATFYPVGDFKVLETVKAL